MISDWYPFTEQILFDGVQFGYTILRFHGYGFQFVYKILKADILYDDKWLNLKLSVYLSVY